MITKNHPTLTLPSITLMLPAYYSSNVVSLFAKPYILIIAILLTITFTKANAQNVQDPSQFTFLNAANFDVTGIGKTNYLGHVNLYDPSIKGGKFGFNTGIMKISYNSDSSSRILAFRRITIDPLQDIKVGSQYLKQSSYISTIVTNTAYSLYAQPTFQLYKDDNENRILFHAHTELLVFNTTAVRTYSGTKQATFTYTSADSANRVDIYKGYASDTSKLTTKRSLLNGYFGIGLTFDLKPWKDGNFFFQPTVGKTTNFPNFEAYLATKTGPIKTWNSFYLIRTYYTQTLNDNSKLVLGADIRGLFPTYKPLYSIYLGLSLNVDALAKLISPGTKS